jgi:hypothetical protein
MGPSTLSTRAPYLGSEIHGPGTQVDSGRTFKSTTVATIHKSIPVAPSSPLRWQPYLGSEIHGLGTQADFGRTLKPARAAIVPWV